MIYYRLHSPARLRPVQFGVCSMSVRDLFELKDRVALITGGSRGLGLQMAAALGEMGARIALCARSGEELARAAAQLGVQGIEAHAVICDLADSEQVPGAVE